MKAAHIGWGKSVGMKVVAVAMVSLACSVGLALLGWSAQRVLARAILTAFPWAAGVHPSPAPPPMPQILAVALGCAVFALLGGSLALVMRGTAGAAVVGLGLMLFAQAPLGWWWLPENAFGALLDQVVAYPAGGLISGTPAYRHRRPSRTILLSWWWLGWCC
jgi:hypothetical protein